MFHKMEGDRRKKRVTLDLILNPHILFWTKLLMLLRYRYRVDINRYIVNLSVNCEL